MSKNKNTLLFLVTKIIAGLAALIAISVRSMYINPTQYSNYYLIVQFVGIFNVVFISWISESCARYYESTTDKKMYYTTYIISLMVAMIVSILLVFSIGYFFSNALVFDYALFVIGIIITSALSEVLTQIFRMSNKVVMFSIMMIFSSISNIVIFIVLPKSMGISSLFLTTILINLVLAIFSFFYLKIYSYISLKSFSYSFLKKSLRYSLPLIIVWGSIWIFNSSNTFLIEYFIGNEQVSFYNMAHTVTFQSLGIITSAFLFAIFPTLLSFWNTGNYEMVEREIGNSITIVIKFLIPAAIGLCAVSPFLYGTIINQSYNPNFEGTILLVLFSISVIIDFIYQIVVRIWNLEEKTINIAISGAVSSVFNLLLSVIFLFLFKNYLLAAIIYLVTIFLRATIVFIIMRKKWKFAIDVKAIFVSLLFSLIMGTTVFYFLKYTPTNLLFLFFGITIGLFVYLVPMIITKQLKRETRLLLSFIQHNK